MSILRLPTLIAWLEDWLTPKCGSGLHRLGRIEKQQYERLKRRGQVWYVTHKKRLERYIALDLLTGYSYGVFLNSIQLGMAAILHTSGVEVEGIQVFSPFQNWFILFTPFGLGVTAVLVLLVYPIAKRGYTLFSGYEFVRNPRGFDILPGTTYGSSGFLTEQEMRGFLEIGFAAGVYGMMLGRAKQREKDPDQFASYVAHRMVSDDNNSLLCIDALGSGKSWGFIAPFLIGCAQRTRNDYPESVIVINPKGELFEKMTPYFREDGLNAEAVNLLDMAHSDNWNCLYSLGQETQLVQTVASTTIQNTSGPKGTDDSWSRTELGLLMVLIHYVCNLKGDAGSLLPIEQRGLGNMYHLLAEKSIREISQILAALPPEYSTKGHHGLFFKVHENLRGNIVIGLDNQLATFQNVLVDKITRSRDVDLLLPGQEPCTYFVITSAQDSTYHFLSSLFFSLAFPRLSNYARPHGRNGYLKVLINSCPGEYYDIGYIEGISDVFNSVRGFNMSCQVVAQSLSQWAGKYLGKDWENQLNTFDQTLYMSRNGLSSIEYTSERCGTATIPVTNNQMLLTPLFFPIYSSTRVYPQTRSDTQRALMQPDEILRLEPGKCIALFNHHKPALLYKLVPEELPGYRGLKPCKVIRYMPTWAKREKRDRARERKTAELTETEQRRPPQVAERGSSGQTQRAGEESAAQRKPVPPLIKPVDLGLDPEYTLSDLERPPQEALGMVETSVDQSPAGMAEAPLDDILGNGPEEKDDLPPRYRSAGVEGHCIKSVLEGVLVVRAA